jgi:hypothetical protein
VIVDAKYTKTAINVRHVESVVALAKAVGADKAVVVAANGWTSQAEEKAKRLRLDLKLFPVGDALEKLREWVTLWDNNGGAARGRPSGLFRARRKGFLVLTISMSSPIAATSTAPRFWHASKPTLR